MHQQQTIRHLLTTVTAALLLTGTAAARSPEESALAKLRSVRESAAIQLFPEECASLAQTVAAADRAAAAGDRETARQLLMMASVKGDILLERLKHLPPPPAAAAPPVFTPLSSAAAPPFTAPVQDTTDAPAPADAAESAWPPPAAVNSPRIVGGEGLYMPRKPERLKTIAARLGVRVRDLARMNRLKSDATVAAGRSLRYNNRHIVPKTLRNGIIVNIPEKNLYLFRNGKLAANYPVALGIAKKNESIIWRTPTGKFTIVDKKENPVWRIPVSIRKEMEENGEEVVTEVQPGPKNPLGKYAMRTTLAGILIHSTTRPSSIYSFSSHGCIRVMPEHMERLFHAITVPINGEIIYQPVKVDVTNEGKIFLEVHADTYEKGVDMGAAVRKELTKYRAADKVSWNKVKRVINEKSGIAEDVTLQ